MPKNQEKTRQWPMLYPSSALKEGGGDRQHSTCQNQSQQRWRQNQTTCHVGFSSLWLGFVYLFALISLLRIVNIHVVHDVINLSDIEGSGGWTRKAAAVAAKVAPGDQVEPDPRVDARLVLTRDRHRRHGCARDQCGQNVVVDAAHVNFRSLQKSHRIPHAHLAISPPTADRRGNLSLSGMPFNFYRSSS